MSTWLDRARAEIPIDDVVPKLPNVPKCPENGDRAHSNNHFGNFGNFGTATLIFPESLGCGIPCPSERTGFALLSPDADPCPGFRRWPKVYAAVQYFLNVHAPQAEAFGWTDLELFSVHPVVGAVRVDYCGVVMLGHDRVVAVSADAIGFASGLVCRRRLVPVDAVLIWNFGKAPA